MDLPQSRQRLRALLEQVPLLLEPAFERDPLLPGAVYERRYRCGRPTCHCRNGERHTYPSLSRWRAGRKDTHSIPPQDEAKVRQWTDAYRRLRQARTDVLRWTQSVVDALDEIERLRTVAETEVPRGTGRRRAKSPPRKETP